MSCLLQQVWCWPQSNYYIQLLFTVYTVDKTQISVQLQQNTKAIYKSYLSIIVRSYFIIMGHWVTGRYGYADKQCHCHADKPCHMRVSWHRIFSSFQWANAMALRPSSVCLSVRPSVNFLRKSLLLPDKWRDRHQTCTRWSPGQRECRVCSRDPSKMATHLTHEPWPM